MALVPCTWLEYIYCFGGVRIPRVGAEWIDSLGSAWNQGVRRSGTGRRAADGTVGNGFELVPISPRWSVLPFFGKQSYVFVVNNLGSLDADIDAVRRFADIRSIEPIGTAAVQLVPSGPGFTADAIHSLLLTTIYGARKELILTTPYFIPDDALLTALQSAALRGVAVTIILPAKNDSKLAAYATRARFEDLIEAGVRLKLFIGGFLHSKTITVDGEFALFGSVNLDMRSFWLNFETTLLLYDQKICRRLRDLQLHYMESAHDLDLKKFAARGPLERFKENVVLLVGPLL